MHVALVSTFYYPRLLGGAEHTLHQHAETLARSGVRVTSLSLHDGAKPEYFRHNGVECRALPAPNLRRCLDRTDRAPAALRSLWHVLDVYNPVAGRLLEQELRTVAPDVVHTETLPGWSCAAWTAAARYGRPHVQMLHDFQLTCPVATRFRGGCNCVETCLTCQPFSALRRRFSQRVSHGIANSVWNEPMGRVVIEAAACGVPVFAARRGGIPELVDTGRTGWLFDSSSPAELTTLLRDASAGRLRARASDCIAFARRFSPDAIIGQWLSLYHAMLGAGRAPRPAAAAPAIATPASC
jgi:glycosyltransferase involved in cell wall biosynthesis